MNYLIDKDFPFELENFLLSEEELEKKGLQIIGKINSEHIVQNSNELKSLFEKIDIECKEKRLWMLLGSNDLKNWLPLQLASVSAEESDIIYEIKTDLKRMTPFDPIKDIRGWKSKFHGQIMQVESGRDIICQKYFKLREKCPYFSIAILLNEEYCNEHIEIISKYQKKEIELAYDLKPLIWNPSPKEKKYINDNFPTN